MAATFATFRCPHCAARFSETVNGRCPYCNVAARGVGDPLNPIIRVQLEENFPRAETRKPPKPRHWVITVALPPLFEEYGRSDAGSPLGHGMPSGRPLREDGQSHRDAWMGIIRRDPCAYCGEESGTVDHIVPRDSLVRGALGTHSWINYTAACGRCNSSKSNTDLLSFLHRRVGTVFAPCVRRAG